MITSRDNPKIKHLIKVKKRKIRDLLFLEGERLVNDALMTLEPYEIFVREGVDFKESTVLSEKIFSEISETENSQGIIGIFKRPHFDFKNLFNLKKVYYLDKVQDPGNLGTIIRSADAFSIDALILRKGSADPYSPKVIRATMGSFLRVAIYFDDDFNILDKWKDNGGYIYSSYLRAEKSVDDLDFKEPYIIVMGNEGSGVSPEVLEKSDDYFYLPMKGNAESLNVAICSSILMYIL